MDCKKIKYTSDIKCDTDTIDIECGIEYKVINNVDIIRIPKGYKLYRGMDIKSSEYVPYTDPANIWGLKKNWFSNIYVAYGYALSSMVRKIKTTMPRVSFMGKLYNDFIFEKTISDVFCFTLLDDIYLYPLFSSNNIKTIIKKINERLKKIESDMLISFTDKDIFDTYNSFLSKTYYRRPSKRIFEKVIKYLSDKKEKENNKLNKEKLNLMDELDIICLGLGYNCSFEKQKSLLSKSTIIFRNLTEIEYFTNENNECVYYDDNDVYYGHMNEQFNRISRSIEHDTKLMDTILKYYNVDGYYAKKTKTLYHKNNVFHEEICINTPKYLVVRDTTDKYDGHNDNIIHLINYFIKYNLFVDNKAFSYPKQYYRIMYNELSIQDSTYFNKNIDTKNGIRILTFNVHMWKSKYGKDNYSKIMDILKEINADIVCLQEVMKRNSVNIPELFEQLEYSNINYCMADGKAPNELYNVMLSKYSFENLYSGKINGDNRCAIMNKFTINHVDFIVVNTHLAVRSNNLMNEFDVRKNNMKYILNKLAQFNNDNVVMVGDFNEYDLTQYDTYNRNKLLGIKYNNFKNKNKNVSYNDFVKIMENNLFKSLKNNYNDVFNEFDKWSVPYNTTDKCGKVDYILKNKNFSSLKPVFCHKYYYEFDNYDNISDHSPLLTDFILGMNIGGSINTPNPIHPINLPIKPIEQPHPFDQPIKPINQPIDQTKKMDRKNASYDIKLDAIYYMDYFMDNFVNTCLYKLYPISVSLINRYNIFIQKNYGNLIKNNNHFINDKHIETINLFLKKIIEQDIS